MIHAFRTPIGTPYATLCGITDVRRDAAGWIISTDHAVVDCTACRTKIAEGEAGDREAPDGGAPTPTHVEPADSTSPSVQPRKDHP